VTFSGIVTRRHNMLDLRPISTAHHLPLLKLQSKRETGPLESKKSIPLLSSSCSPGFPFLRLFSSSPSTTLLPPTTTYEELCTALASEDVLVVDVRQVPRHVYFSTVASSASRAGL